MAIKPISPCAFCIFMQCEFFYIFFLYFSLAEPARMIHAVISWKKEKYKKRKSCRSFRRKVSLSFGQQQTKLTWLWHDAMVVVVFRCFCCCCCWCCGCWFSCCCCCCPPGHYYLQLPFAGFARSSCYCWLPLSAEKAVSSSRKKKKAK